MAQSGRTVALAASLLDFPAGPRLRHQSRPHPGPLPAPPGRAKPWDRAIMCSALMRRPASRRAGANIPHYRRHQDGRFMSSTHTLAPCLGLYRCLGRPSRQVGSAVVSARRELPRSTAWSRKSCVNNCTALREAYFWIVDNGSSHRGQRVAAQQMAQSDPRPREYLELHWSARSRPL
jgi:hypothetical protein